MWPASKAGGAVHELDVPEISPAPRCRLSTAANQLMTRTE